MADFGLNEDVWDGKLQYLPIQVWLRAVHSAPINVIPPGGGGGAGRAWGGHLIVFVGPGVGHLTDLVLPGEGIFESFFARRADI